MRIELSSRKHRNEYAIIDDEDYELVSKYNWNACFHGGSDYKYARSSGKNMVSMHRVIMGVTDPKVHVDHINHNGLDNRKCNLRLCNNSQNQMNRKKASGCSSIYKGVSYAISRNKKNPWLASIRINGKKKHIGHYATQEDAARAYNEMAQDIHGDFAKLNIIGGAE